MTVSVLTLVERAGPRTNGRPLPEGDVDVLVDSITQDSRLVRAGSLFCAIQGDRADGHDYVAAAAEAGAAAALVRHRVDANVPQIVVDDPRWWTGVLSAALEEFPSVELDVVGVTGTNGKTSTVTIVEHLMNHAGRAAASMGTLTGALTTSAAPDFQAALRGFVNEGREVVATEVSSHALDQDRVAGTDFAVSIFTNLSQDHLDYHPDMESYFEAKAKLFTSERTRTAVVDVSDEWGVRLAQQVSVPVIAVDGTAIASRATLGPSGSTFGWRGRTVQLPLGGRFSVANAVLAAEACVALGASVDSLVEGLGSTPQIPGRFELIDAGQPFVVLVDYSHTPASVSIAVESARDLTDGDVLIVFGAAGDRDPGKRPLMAEAASAADQLFVTSDNPRTEDPDQILAEVMAGVAPRHIEAGTARAVVDRSTAIHDAIAAACEGDVVVIAGKGHEDYQIIGTTKRDFDDRIEARSALRELGWEQTP